MIRQTVCVGNQLGLHARAAAKLVRVASRYSSQIVISREGVDNRCDAKSIFGILMLAASQGVRLIVSIEGSDEAEAGEAIRRLFEDKFGEEL
jgi:phosphocarrier protein